MFIVSGKDDCSSLVAYSSLIESFGKQEQLGQVKNRLQVCIRLLANYASNLKE